MNIKEFIDAMCLFPPFFKDLAILMAILSLVEISPVKLNPWKWIKKFIELPDRLDKLEQTYNNDKAYRWRRMILATADRVMRGEKLSEERWNDTIETIDNYLNYCEEQERLNSTTFINGKANAAIEYLQDKYKEVLELGDFLDRKYTRKYKLSEQKDKAKRVARKADFSGEEEDEEG